MAQYYTDFSEYLPGTKLSETARWERINDSLKYTVIDPTYKDGNVLRISEGSGIGTTVLVDKSAGTSSDIEILLKLSVNNSVVHYPIARYENSNNGYGYAYELQNGSSYGNYIRLYNDGTTRLALGNGGWDDNGGYYKIKCVGDQIKVKWWSPNESEPSAWELEVTDTTLSSGKAGIISVNDRECDIDMWGVGTNGDPAPTSPLFDFQTTITGTNTPVTSGDSLTVDVDVTNIGTGPGEDDVTLDINELI